MSRVKNDNVFVILLTAVAPSKSKSSPLQPGPSQGSNSLSPICPLNLLIAASV